VRQVFIGAAAVLVVWAVPACDQVAPLGRFLLESVPRDVPALTVVIVDRDNELFNRSVGMRDVAAGAALAPGGIFRIASMTKPITSLAIMMLHEEGKLDVDAPVTQYLPQFDRVRVMTRFDETDATYESRPPRRPVLVRHLLNHTSGIGYSFADPRLARLDEGKVSELDMPLLHDPGDRWSYGPGTNVLGQIVERVSGRPLDRFLSERIFQPLGMHDTAYVVPTEKRHRVVTVHLREREAWVEQPNANVVQSAVQGDSGLFSTGHDYGVLMQLFQNRGRHGATRLVDEESIVRMTTNQIGDLNVERQTPSNPAIRPFPIGAGKDKFGFGFQVETAPIGPGLRSAGSYSWGGIYNTHFWIDPQKQIGVVVLMQVLPYYGDAPIRVLRGFERIVYQQPD
jgi:methyl acetate hydrolase